MTGLVGPEYWAQDFFFGGLKVTVIFHDHGSMRWIRFRIVILLSMGLFSFVVMASFDKATKYLKAAAARIAVQLLVRQSFLQDPI